MNKALSILLAIAIAAVVAPVASSLPSPPPGIAEGTWIPMGEAAGFVITGSAASNSLKGYFMARREGIWFRVDSTPDYEAHPTICPNARRNPLFGL
ncbi:MAG TPA: hypothetical protein VNW26_07325 [Steroidobacteraceae bacterium]|jgi:hypothetical protein|nr:hypothetical protein [Steroidobacteraceae bacterium]